METNSSGEDLAVKTRKPYTITKQREKWTEEEHNKFIEALKLHGRAWQRIEEHIGTKTAVQIRSHAQKFFTKLEKEAVMKGVPLGQAHDIEIPPPRPKRKPSCPYPRKTGAGSSFSPSGEALEEKTPKSSSPLSTCKQAIDIENNASWKIQGARDNSEDGSCSEVLNLFQDAPAASISSLTKGSAGLCAYNGFMHLNKEMKDKATLKGSSVSIEANGHMKGNGTANANHGSGELKGNCKSSQMKSAQEGAEISKQPDKISSLVNNPRGDQSNTKHVPIDFLKRSGDGNVPATITGQDRAHVNAKPSTIPAISSTSEMNTNSGMSSIHQSFPAFSPITQFPSSQDAYHSFLNISSTFSSLIVSNLLQNPAVHVAASVAASFWPPAGLDVPVDSSSETVHGGIPTSSMNPTPSMAAIAAATVEAASAWWATQGLLPIYPPLHTGFAFASALTTTAPTVDIAPASDGRKEDKGDRFENSIGIDQQDVAPEQSEAVRAQHPSSKSLSSSSDSEESARGEPVGAKTNKFKPLLNNGVDDSDEARNKKKLDRSSCCSNTPSSSEVETGAVLKKQDGDKDAAKQVQQNNPPSAETNDRRIRSSSSMNESWKEVSEEGRLAFKALFNRGVLPQSFSPPLAKNLMVMTAKAKEATNELLFDLNVKASSEPTDVYFVQEFGDKSGKGPLTSDISQGKLRARRMGFKPYERCSMEAKESRGATRGATGDETGNKRIRLEGETCI